MPLIWDAILSLRPHDCLPNPVVAVPSVALTVDSARTHGQPGTLTGGARIDVACAAQVNFQLSPGHDVRPSVATTRSARRVRLTAPRQNRWMDHDLTDMDRAHLIAEVIRLRTAIRAHRDSSGHDLCWHHPDLWATLPEPMQPSVAVPPWPQFMRGCVAYRQSLDEQLRNAPAHIAEYDAGEK